MIAITVILASLSALALAILILAAIDEMIASASNGWGR